MIYKQTEDRSMEDTEANDILTRCFVILARIGICNNTQLYVVVVVVVVVVYVVVVVVVVTSQ